MDRFNSKQLTIVIVCITAFFITMAVFTMVAGSSDDSSSKDRHFLVDGDGSDEGGRK